MIDLIRWFIDRPVREVTAMTARLLKPSFAEDNAMLLMRFEGDILASVQSSWTARPFPERRIAIHGERGHFVLDGSSARPLTVYLQEGGQVLVPEIPATSMHGDPFSHFIQAIQQGTPPLTSGAEGRAGLAVALAAYDSAHSGRAIQLAD